jgi:hypothetical protein
MLSTPLHLPERRLVDIADLKFDAPFRRSVNNSTVNSYVKNYGVMPFPDLEVSERENGDLVLIAGYHRCSAATRLGIESLWARVYTDLSLKEEAEIFDREAHHKALTPFDRHRNALEMQDDRAHAVEHVLRQANVKLTNGGRGPRELSAVAAVYQAYEWGVLADSVTALVDWCAEHNTYPSGDALSGLAFLIKSGEPPINLDRLGRVLRTVSPNLVRSQAAMMSRSSRPGSTQFRNWAAAILPYYNKRLSARRLRLVGEEDRAA